MLLPTDELWTASITGTDLSTTFAMPAGSTEGAARMRAWHIWSHARANGSNDPAAPVAAFGLTVVRVAVAMVAQSELAA